MLITNELESLETSTLATSELRNDNAVRVTEPESDSVEEKTVEIASRAISSMEYAPLSLFNPPVDPWSDFLRTISSYQVPRLFAGASGTDSDDECSDSEWYDDDEANGLIIGTGQVPRYPHWMPIVNGSEDPMVLADEDDGPLTASGIDGGGIPPTDITMEYLTENYTNLTAMAKSGDFKDVIGRDKEARQVLQAMIGGFAPRHVVLFGDAGIGKRRLLKRVAHLMTHQSLPPQLANKQLIQFDLKEAMESSDWQQKFRQFLRECSQLKEEVIAVLPNVSDLSSMGWQARDLLATLRSHMDDGLQVLATSTKEIRPDQIKPEAWKLSQIEVLEFSRDDMVAYLAQRYSRRERSLQVTVQKEAVEAAFSAAERQLNGSSGASRKEVFELACDMLELAAGEARLRNTEAQEGDEPLPLFPVVDAATVKLIARTFYSRNGSVTSDTPISGRIDTHDPLQIADRLKAHVFGQDEAVESVANAIILANSGLHDPEESGPIGSFLFLGPTGVGKTELAKTLAKDLKLPFTTFDMTEYQEKHTVSRLFGAPPGYVGYDEGGQLTEFVKRFPKAVILLDEIEKAHRDVLLPFMQVFDEGRMTDGQGNTIDCSQVVFVMTSNLMSPEITKLFQEGKSTKEVNEIMKPVLQQYLRPELLNRLTDFITFRPLSRETFKQLIPMKLHRRFKPVKEVNGIDVKWGNDVFEYLCDFGFDPELGLRPLKRLIEKALIKPLSIAVLKEEVKRGDKVELYVTGSGVNRSIAVRKISGD